MGNFNKKNRLGIALISISVLSLLSACSEDKFKIAVEKKTGATVNELLASSSSTSNFNSSSSVSSVSTSVSSSVTSSFASSSTSNSSVNTSNGSSVSSSFSSAFSSVSSATSSTTSNSTTEIFSTAGSSGPKKIDFLFVIDNSQSMADNQTKLAAGFKQFADTFYRRADLDICTAIITSDRYLGRTTSTGYQRERYIACTKPAGYQTMSASDLDTYISNLIADFVVKTNVGTSGNQYELLGKSLITFLNQSSSWGAADGTAPTIFFRKDAVANITFLTDENNYYFSSSVSEKYNDLPSVSPFTFSANGSTIIDSRTGLKNYIDSFFNTLNPTKGLSYSITSILELTSSIDKASNLFSLTQLVGRESISGDIQGSATDYANLYNSISNNIVSRTTSFTLTKNYQAVTSVAIIHTDGSRANLSLNTGYTLLAPNSVSLTAATVRALLEGDKVEIKYSY